MSNTYNKSYASLHTVKHDTTVLDAQKILVKTPENSINSRTDLIEYIQKENNKSITLTNELRDKLSPYSEEQIYESPKGEAGTTDANILVIPANIFDSSTIFTQVILGGGFKRKSSIDDSPRYYGPLYLGVLFCDSNGNKSIVGVSERYELKLGDSRIRFKFNKNPFIVPPDTRIILYFLKAPEDLALEYPNYTDLRPSYDSNGNESIYDPFDSTGQNWQRGQSDIDLGFHLRGSWSIYDAYMGWPAISLAVDPHHSNPSHLTVEQYKKINAINLDELVKHDDAITKDNSDWQEIKQQVVVGTLKEKYYTTNLENRTNATTACNIKIDDTHFIPGGSIISNIGLAYSEGNHSGFSTPHWCHIYPYDSADTLIGDAIISTNTATRPGDQEGVTTWEFAGDATSRLPENYDYIIIKVSGTNTPHPNANGTEIRMSVANINGTSSHSSFGDKCAVTGGQGPGPYLAVVNVDYLAVDKTLLERIEVLESIDHNDININISELEETVASHATSIQSMGVSIADHTTTIGEHTTSINTHAEEIADIKEKIESVRRTAQFSNLSGNTNVTSGHCIQLSKAHFIKPGNIITKLYLPYKDNDQGVSDQYSHIQFFDESETLISQFDSEDTQSRAGGATGISVWTYNDVVVPEYKFVRFTLSGSKTDRPNGQAGQNCTPYRINVVTQENGTYFDEDDCEVWNSGSKTNWVGEVKVDYAYLENLNNTIIEIKDSLTELESKNYAYTDTENTFAENINVNKTLYADTSISPESNVASISANNKLIVGRESITSEELDQIKSMVLGKESLVATNTESSAGIYEVVCGHIENPHFPSGTISNIRIFHNADHEDLFDKTPRYLYLNVDGEVYRSHALVWDGPIAYSDFRFDNITIPNDYSFVDILMSTNPELENPSWTNYSGAINFSASVSTGDTYGNSRVRMSNGVPGESIIIKVEATIGTTTGNNIITTIDNAIRDVVGENVGNYITEEEAREIIVEEVEQGLLDKDVSTFFDSNNLGVGNNDYSHNDGAGIKCARISKKHFISPGSMITSIVLPYKNNGTAWQNQWLHIQYYDASGALIKQDTSNNTQNRTTASDNVYYKSMWTFDEGTYVPAGYSYIHINVSGSKTDVPTTTTNCTIFRASIVRDANDNTFDDDECHIWLSNNTSGNNLLHYEVNYVERVGEVVKRVASLEENITNLLSYIERLEQRITELEERGAARLRRS